MRVSTTPRFDRAIKKISPAEKKTLDSAVKQIISEPFIGEMKKGDLLGVQVYKFRHLQQQMLLAYSVSLDGAQIALIGYGVHENFYRDLKR
ncbi:MAG: type II toxin-antitoxin system RelE/ParE family toxin [Polynucleobacter sp.]|jgi:mRNA-degrading endonuclease YafQ of YafQ-DinJ toxin-antitoxin module|uniref:type II toxin-antitoxin system RelE/ParE family toxin n=1 Tax=Polynucleobacter sp. 78F-HAINBA TaxID=2689099 RepID=UPI001B500540|nr:type II toxin-antitoxin system RelE/ParE family toxin [Polynucleobacter sp. 78F-HAINBA]MBP7943261.1 type II toxin-antitoxin system RelE/ParE family toxin [Polynucleobacter sp.]MBU3592000.1 type II toxin-antitoxin system RelE/ParE family toxin [Polynucleobacter sp. 78F-HAINBA]